MANAVIASVEMMEMALEGSPYVLITSDKINQEVCGKNGAHTSHAITMQIFTGGIVCWGRRKETSGKKILPWSVDVCLTSVHKSLAAQTNSRPYLTNVELIWCPRVP